MQSGEHLGKRELFEEMGKQSGKMAYYGNTFLIIQKSNNVFKVTALVQKFS